MRRKHLRKNIDTFITQNPEYFKLQRFTSSSEGEWNWIHSTKTRKYVISISEDRKLLKNFLKSPLKSDCAYGLLTPVTTEKRDSDNSFQSDVNLIYDMTEKTNANFLEHTILFKNDYTKFCKAYKCYPDSPRHYFFAQQISALVDTSRVGVEIGGGYGGLLYYLIKNKYAGKLVNCDLIESLLISYMFLNSNGIETILCVTDSQLQAAFLSQAKIILITPNLFPSLPVHSSIEFIFNSRSLSEMSFVQVDEYLNVVNRTLLPKFFLSENAEELLFPNSIRHIEILQSSIAELLSNYELIHDFKSKFSGGSGRYSTKIFQHISN